MMVNYVLPWWFISYLSQRLNREYTCKFNIHIRNVESWMVRRKNIFFIPIIEVVVIVFHIIFS